MKVAPGILLLFIGELESIFFFQDSNRLKAKTEKQKEKNPSTFVFHLSTISPLSGYFRHSVLNCLFAVQDISRTNSFVEVEGFVYRLPRRCTN